MKEDLYQLFEAGIQDMYAVENEIIKALPDLIKEAREPKLKEALRNHLEETKEQAVRLEEIADELEIELESEPSKAMQAILQNGQECVEECSSEIKDAAIIGACQCVEHYEMAMYGTLKAFAEILDLELAEKKLDESLEEEGEADKKLSKLAETINKKACDKGGS